MSSLFVALFALVASSFRTRAALQAEILALGHQLAVLQKNVPRRVRFHRCDRFLWVVWSRFWSGWRRCLQMVRPDTVLRWQRRAFAWQWTRKSRRLPGRPEVAWNIRDLIRRRSPANPLWGAPPHVRAKSLCGTVGGLHPRYGVQPKIVASNTAKLFCLLALGKGAPEPRAVEPPAQGRVVAIPQVGGLHHRYQRRAA